MEQKKVRALTKAQTAELAAILNDIGDDLKFPGEMSTFDPRGMDNFRSWMGEDLIDAIIRLATQADVISERNTELEEQVVKLEDKVDDLDSEIASILERC